MPTDDTTPAAPRWHGWAAVALLAVHAVLVWKMRAFSINTGNDDARYVLLSRSIRDFGYNDIYLPGSPPHPMSPPGFPALLAILSLPFGERFSFLLAVVILCSIAALALLYDCVRRRNGSTVALAVLAVCAVNPGLTRFSGELMSEAPYLLFTMLAVWAVLREPQQGGIAETAAPHTPSAWWPTLAIAAATYAALIRTIGVTFLGALLVLWVLEGRYRRAVALAAVGGITVGSWITWTILAPVKIVGRSYVADATVEVGGGTPHGLVSVLFHRVVNNVPGYLTEDLAWWIPEPTVAGTVIDNVVGLVVLTTLCVVGGVVLWKRARIVVLYALAYCALLAVWAWRLPRFLVPIMPFVLWLLIVGAFSLATRRRWLRPLPHVVGGIIVITALSRNATRLEAAARCDRSAPMTSPGCYADIQRSFFEAAKYIREATPDTSIFLTVKEATLAYFSTRRVVGPTTVAVQDSAILSGLNARSIDYIVLTPLHSAFEERVPALLKVCTHLEIAKAFPASTYLLKVPPANAPPSRDNACQVLEKYEVESAPLREAFYGPPTRQ